jgi:hypothetical protein
MRKEFNSQHPAFTLEGSQLLQLQLQEMDTIWLCLFAQIYTQTLLLLDYIHLLWPARHPPPALYKLLYVKTFWRLLPKAIITDILLHATPCWIHSQDFYCCNETPWPKRKLGRKGFIWLTVLHHWFLLKEVRTAIQTGQEPRGRIWCKSHGGVLLTGFSWLAQLAFLQPRNGTNYNGFGLPLSITN